MGGVFDGFDKLISPASVGKSVQDAFKQGQVQGVLNAFSKDPRNPEIVNRMFAIDPSTALKLRDYQHEETKGERDDEFRSALGGFVRSQRPTTSILASHGALGGSASGAPRIPNLASLAGEEGTTATLRPSGQAPDVQPSTSGTPIIPAPDYSILGRPENDQDQYFLKMLETDPAKAMEVDSKLRDNMLGRLKDEHEAFGYGVARLAGVRDEATYHERRTDIIQRLGPMGIDASTVLPEQYPGEDGIAEIRMQALGVKDQISAFLNRDKADASTANIEADNARADRNTDSIIRDRGERTGIATDRARDARTNASRRDATTRRGQDRRGKGVEGPVKVTTKAEAMALPPGTKYRAPDGLVRTR